VKRAVGVYMNFLIIDGPGIIVVSMEPSRIMRIAVVVASVNRAEEVGQLLFALRGQSLQPSAIILSVVSKTDLPEVLPPDVEIVMGSAGLTIQRNRGLEMVVGRCEVVVFFDDDFIPTKDALQGIRKLFETYPDVVGGTGLVLRDGVGEGGISYESALEIIRDFEAQPVLPIKNEDYLFAYGCNMAFRTSVIGNLRFDENLPLYGWQEDMDFAAQISVQGKVIRTTAFAGVHRGVTKGRTPGKAMGFSQIVNPVYLVRKGTMTPKKALTLIIKNVLANHAKFFQPEPFVDRRGRLLGNWLGVLHLLQGKTDPTFILSCRK